MEREEARRAEQRRLTEPSGRSVGEKTVNRRTGPGERFCAVARAEIVAPPNLLGIMSADEIASSPLEDMNLKLWDQNLRSSSDADISRLPLAASFSIHAIRTLIARGSRKV